VNLAWPFKARVNDEQNQSFERSFRGNPQPDFFCVGAQKGGTSWLYQQLQSHPDFWMPPIKELHYFDKLGRTAFVFISSMIWKEIQLNCAVPFSVSWVRIQASQADDSRLITTAMPAGKS
jgi:hypothetical protein